MSRSIIELNDTLGVKILNPNKAPIICLSSSANLLTHRKQGVNSIYGLLIMKTAKLYLSLILWTHLV